MNTIDISIIIRTLNEERYLDSLLKGITSQKSSLTYEIILIDSGSNDRTLEIASNYNCSILHISRNEFSFGRSLNRACEAASGSYLVLISGHCIPFDECWLNNLVHPLTEQIVQYTYGRQIGGPLTYWSENQIFANYYPALSAIPQEGFYCNNANSALLAEIWKKYNFDEELTGLEDMYLAKQLVLDGGSVGYVADAIVHHIHHESWSQVQRRFEREALALKEICPEVILRRRDVVVYIIREICRDVFSRGLTNISLKFISEIIKYRYFQYTGSFKGNHSRKKLCNQLRDTYFYPRPTKSKPLTYQSNSNV